MTTRNRRFTPRRRKLFGQFNETIVLGAGTSSPKLIDMLDSTFTDLGANTLGGLTFMNARGQMKLVQNTASPVTSSAYAEIRVGMFWADQLMATVGDGSGLIPEPLQDGTRETKWIQQWQLGAVEPPVAAPIIVGAPLDPIEESLIRDINVRNMRKQPTAESKLSLVVSGGSTFEANVVSLTVALFIMVALP